MAAPGRRWTWKFWRATCRRASRPVPSLRSVGGQAAAFVNVFRGDAGEVGAWIGETHRAEDFIESTPESGRNFFQR